jgi:hypothetical protein
MGVPVGHEGFFRKINRCIDVRGMFDDEAAKGEKFYYRGL